MTKARDLANSAAAFASVSATELAFVDGVTSAIQTQMDAKASLTGTETLTNKTLTSPVIASVINNTLTSTTGDIIYASAANTPARLGIGTTGQVLNVASGVPAWATPASGSTFVGAGGLSSAILTVSHGTATRIVYGAEAYDTDSIHSTSTNTGRFTVPAGKAGYYLCSANITCEGTVSATGVFWYIYVNNASTGTQKQAIPGGSGEIAVQYSRILNLAVADYVEFYIQQNSGGNRDFYSGAAQGSFGQVTFLGA